MRLVFTELGWEDYLWFQDNDRQLLKRINLLSGYVANARKRAWQARAIES